MNDLIYPSRLKMTPALRELRRGGKRWRNKYNPTVICEVVSAGEDRLSWRTIPDGLITNWNLDSFLRQWEPIDRVSATNGDTQATEGPPQTMSDVHKGELRQRLGSVRDKLAPATYNAVRRALNDTPCELWAAGERVDTPEKFFRSLANGDLHIPQCGKKRMAELKSAFADQSAAPSPTEEEEAPALTEAQRAEVRRIVRVELADAIRRMTPILAPKEEETPTSD